MRLKMKLSCDVLVIGSGIAGISAALKAAEAGSRVILACKGKLFSGSSFYPGTWGLGLIGPDGPEDEADLAATIARVGCNMVDPRMVQTFVEGIPTAISRVRQMGVKLKRADDKTQKEFIPCFDHKHRDWNGILFDSAREVFGRRLEEWKVQILSHCDILDLVQENGRVCGAVLADQKELFYARAGSVVLATGGYGSLFKYHLCTTDVTGVGQYLALKAGCELINMEFMQMMPGYITPAYQTIFNEKTFRFTHLSRDDGTELLNKEEALLLEERSSHGPFTTRLSSKAVDIALFHEFAKNEKGVCASYHEEIKQNPPEFVQVYFDWLLQSKGIGVDDPIHIGIFSHAANGGIRIRPDASTAVPGLFAAGEVTGGMHGADRIGGLSTANGLVFGSIAGESASAYSAQIPDGPAEYEFTALETSDLINEFKTLQQCMFENAMIIRNEKDLSQALDTVTGLYRHTVSCLQPGGDISRITQTTRFLAGCRVAESILQAELLRKESRGSHYRTDHPLPDPGQEKMIRIHMDETGIHADYMEEVKIQ